MGAGKERRALERTITAWRRVVFGERQSIRRPQEGTPVLRRGGETSSEGQKPSG